MNLSQADSSFFVGWGTLSLINAGLAQSKGRSGIGWWLVWGSRIHASSEQNSCKLSSEFLQAEPSTVHSH